MICSLVMVYFIYMILLSDNYTTLLNEDDRTCLVVMYALIAKLVVSIP